MPRYGLRFADSLVPTVLVVDPAHPLEWDGVVAPRLVKRVRGFTRAHAFNRALTWSRKHGDPR